MVDLNAQAKLSLRELEIAHTYAGGASYREIAERLFIAPTTVRTHLSTIYRKLGVSSKVELFRVLKDHPLEAPTPGTDPEPNAFPEKPTIAVLPFANFSADPKFDFLADGITEDIITALSRVPDLPVMARHSSFAYKDRSVSAQEAAEELGVSCILEGSVRVAAGSVRVVTQLIEGTSGHHLWAERYDGALDDIFTYQDEISRKIGLALQVTLTYGELARLWEGQTENLRAWERMLEGRRLFNQMNKSDVRAARRQFEDALDLDPNYGGALLQLGLTHWWQARYDLDVRVGDALHEGEAIVTRLFDLGNNDSAAHYLKGYLAFIRRDFDLAIPELETAVALSPNDSWITGVLGQLYVFAGRPETAAQSLRQAMRLSPYYPDWYAYNLALAYAWSGERPQEAVASAEWYINRLPHDPYGYSNLAIVQAFAGQEDEAATSIARLRRRDPDFGLANLRRSELYRDPASLERVLAVLRKAGLPDDKPLPETRPGVPGAEATTSAPQQSRPERLVFAADGSIDLPLPDKPSIVVLPFESSSGHHDEAFFADGITEDLIARLSYLRDLMVIARTSSFAYKGRAVRVEAVARDLGVGHVLEGSVRKVGKRVRVTAQLIDGTNGRHIWAQRFDRELTDIFSIQDEITQAIVVAMQVELTDGEVVKLSGGGTQNLAAWEAFHQGILAFLTYTSESNRTSRKLLEQALEFDRNYLDAKVYLSWTYWQDARSGFSPDRAEALATCRRHNDDLRIIGDWSANVRHLEAATLLIERRHAEAVEAAASAVALGPCKIFGYTPSALANIYSGNVQAGVDLLRTTMRLSPYCPSDAVYTLAYALSLLGDHENAIRIAQHYVERVPSDLFAYTLQAMAFSFAGDEERARAAIERLRALFPSFTLQDFIPHEPYRNPKDLDRVVTALAAAGLPAH